MVENSNKKERIKIYKHTISRRRSRLLAMIIDGFILSAPYFILLHFLKIDFTEYSKNYLANPIYWIFFIGGIVYHTYFHGRYGQTPGKKIVKIKVINPRGKNLDYKLACLRIASTYILGILPIIGYIFSYSDIAFAFFRKDRRSIHDLIVNSVVVDIVG